jgi:hypothetical protein
MNDRTKIAAASKNIVFVPLNRSPKNVRQGYAAGSQPLRRLSESQIGLEGQWRGDWPHVKTFAVTRRGITCILLRCLSSRRRIAPRIAGMLQCRTIIPGYARLGFKL